MIELNAIIEGKPLEAATAGLTQEDINQIVYDVASSALDYWIQLAQERLNQTRQDYIQNLRGPEMGSNIATLTLEGALPNLIEHGMPSVDLRSLFLGDNIPVVGPGQKGKRESKDGGFYRAVPFKHTSPGSGSSKGVPMGNPYQASVKNAKALGRQVYQAAKKLEGTRSMPGGGNAYGASLPAGMGPVLQNAVTGQRHATDLYAGMIRQEKTYAQSTQTAGYMTFRTISTSVSRGWIRPAIAGQNIAEDVQRFAAEVLPEALRAYNAERSGK